MILKKTDSQNNESESTSDKLQLANTKLAFQNEEKEIRAAELLIANKELIFQNEEKEKRAAELLIANKELAFQNEEKEKRAAELLIANTELVFQNEEKEKRAAELLIANKELAFQNEEKEKRAMELSIANKKLAFQILENERRSHELNTANIANIKLAIQNEERIFHTAQLEAVNKELESFSYSVSHDLRSPLRAILGYATMLKEACEGKADTEANRLMNNIITYAKKMGHLIDDLLAFSHLGRKELVKISVPMHELVAQLCTELKHEHESRIIEFEISPLLSAKADKVTIQQVWVNLISNAIKYSKLKDKTTIHIDSREEGDDIVYSIKDNGAGFDMRYASKLFGVFQRLHSEDEFEGTGVGLAIVQRIIAKHGGRVWAESIVDKGSTFFFTLNKL